MITLVNAIEMVRRHRLYWPVLNKGEGVCSFAFYTR